MDLWIRTQKQDQLIHAEEIKIQNNTYDDESQILVANKHTYHYAGKYKTKERALEILDEIQHRLKNQFIVDVHPLLPVDDMKRLNNDLSSAYKNNEFIMQPQACELKPINKDIIVYELPKE